MADFMSDAEFMGTDTPAVAGGKAPASSGKFMTEEQFTGRAAQVETSKWDKIKTLATESAKGAYDWLTKPVLDESNSSVFERGQKLTPPTMREYQAAEPARQAAAAAPQIPPTDRPTGLKIIGRGVAGTLPQLADMLTSTGKQLVTLPVYSAGYAYQRSQGVPDAEAAKEAMKNKDILFPNEIFAPWSTIAENLGGEVKAAYDKNPVAWAMGKIGEIVSSGADKTAEKLGVPTEHLTAITDELMGLMGAHAFKPHIVHAVATRLEQALKIPSMEGAGGFGELKGAPNVTMAPPTPPEVPPEATPQETAAATKQFKQDQAAHLKAVNGLVVDKGQLQNIFGLAKKEGPAAEAALVKNLFDRVLKPVEKVETVVTEGEVSPTPGEAPPGSFPPGEGVPRTRLAEGTVIGDAPKLIDSGVEKLRRGLLLSKAEADAVRKLTVDDEAKIVAPDGKTIFQRGEINDGLLKTLGVMGVGGVLATKLVDWYSSPGLSDDNSTELGLAAAGAAGILKGEVFTKLHPEFANTTIKTPTGELASLYHGGRGIEGEMPSQGTGRLGQGLYLTDSTKRASGFGKDGAVYPAYTNLKNPITAEAFADRFGLGIKAPAEAKKITEQLTKEGYDGVVDKVGDRYNEVVVFEPTTKVKSAISGKARPEDLAKIAGGAALTAYAMSDSEKDPMTMAAIGLAGTVALGKTRFAGMPEPEVLKAFREGTGRSKELAAAQIYESTRKQLERSVRGMGKDLPVEDIVQRVYEKAFRTLALAEDDPRAFKGEARLSTYLHSIAANEVKSAWRAEKARPKLYEPPAETPEGDTASATAEEGVAAGTPVESLANKQLAGKMQTAIDKLPDNFRNIFTKIAMEGKDYQTVADELGVPIGTVRSGFARAKEHLQSNLREYKDLQSGKIDPATLGKLALVGGGAAIGMANSEDPTMGALGGAAAGFAAAALFHVPVKEIGPYLSKAFAPDTRIRSNQLADLHDGNMENAKRTIAQQVRDVTREAPTPEDQTAITHAIQHGRVASLPEAARQGAGIAKTFFDSIAGQAQKLGVLKDLIDDYATNLWDLTGKNKDVWDRILNAAGGPSMSPETRFALTRKIANIEQGKSLGLVPLTENIGDIMHIYGISMARTMENARMITSLKAEVDPVTGNKLLMESLKAPHAYVTIDSPQLTGIRVHPDIAPSMKFIFDRENAGVAKQGLQALNTAVKRSAVQASLFHVKALLDAHVGATTLSPKLLATGAGLGAAYGAATGSDAGTSALIGAGASMMLPGLTAIGKAAFPKAFGEAAYLKQLYHGEVGDSITHALNSGLKISMEKGLLANEDVGGAFYSGMKLLQNGMDAVIPHSGAPVKALMAVNHSIDGFMWERLHPSMKLSTWHSSLEKLTENNAAAHVKDPVNNPLKSQEELGKEAASFTNDIYGGLDWRRIAEESKTKWGRDLALQVYSPAARRAAQLALFAPDWTVSTMRAATRALPNLDELAHPGKMLRDFVSPTDAVDLHRQYMVRSALYYATIANGINYAMSGHFIWDNKDPTTVDLGDGRTMQWSKHMMEPFHWAMKPMQQMANKLGFLPKEAINQLTGKEYISTAGNAPPMDTSALGRLEHVGKSILPIAAQGAFGGKASMGGLVSSSLGIPIYGKTYEERAAMKDAMKELHASPEYKQLQADKRALKRQAAE